jgi:hypothetical protein
MSHDGALVGQLITGPEVLDFRTLHTRRGHGGCLSIVLDREIVLGFHFPFRFRYTHEDFCGWLSIIQKGVKGHRVPFDLGRYRLSAHSRSANKRKSVMDTWKIYREFSKLSLFRAAYWWTIYIWNTFWLYRRSRPVEAAGTVAQLPLP